MKKSLKLSADVVEKIRKDRTLRVMTNLRAGDPSCPGGTGPCGDKLKAT
jgi:hypothetical protein